MRIAICEDDACQRDLMMQYIFEHKDYNSEMEVSVFSSGEELLRSFADGIQYDLLFLDIQMKDIDGIETAREIRKTNGDTIIFFVTGFTEYISDAFIVDAFQFLHKPVQRGLFIREFSRAINKHRMQSKTYTINGKSRVITLELKEVFYLEVFNHQIVIHTSSNKYEKLGKMDEEEKILKP